MAQNHQNHQNPSFHSKPFRDYESTELHIISYCSGKMKLFVRLGLSIANPSCPPKLIYCTNSLLSHALMGKITNE